ncbi:MAG: tetratricopeptide repeat protein [Bacteroidota bacterium]
MGSLARFAGRSLAPNRNAWKEDARLHTSRNPRPNAASGALASFTTKHALWMAHAHLLRGDAEIALTWFDRLESEAFRAEAAYHRGLALAELHRWAEAEQAFATAAEGDEPWRTAGLRGAEESRRRREGEDSGVTLAAMPPPFLAEAVVRKARALMESGQIAQALSHLEQALCVAPETPELLGMTGACLVQLQSFDRAVPLLQRAASKLPHLAWPLANLALAFGGLRQHGDAVAAMRTAVAVEPHQACMHQMLARQLEAAGLPAEALDEYAATLALDPSDAFARQRWDAISAAAR